MPDDTLIEAGSMTDARTALICARLNLRGGKRRLQKGLKRAGVTALYDSVFFGMHYYIAKHKSCESIVKDTDLWDSAALFHVLARAGVFDDPLLFNRFSLIVEHALWQGSSLVDVGEILAEVEEMLTRLGVIRTS
jgi:hypothetical protein